MWTEVVFAAFEMKAEGLCRGRFSVDHLLIYDLTGLNLLLHWRLGCHSYAARSSSGWSANNRRITGPPGERGVEHLVPPDCAEPKAPCTLYG
jgi:hypothetical protein